MTSLLVPVKSMKPCAFSTRAKSRVRRRSRWSAARDNDLAFDRENHTLPVAHRLGVQEVEASIETLRNYIDWTPFFMTWSLAGKYPRILEDEVVGVEAQRLFKDANDLLDKLSAGVS